MDYWLFPWFFSHLPNFQRNFSLLYPTWKSLSRHIAIYRLSSLLKILFRKTLFRVFSKFQNRLRLFYYHLEKQLFLYFKYYFPILSFFCWQNLWIFPSRVLLALSLDISSLFLLLFWRICSNQCLLPCKNPERLTSNGVLTLKSFPASHSYAQYTNNSRILLVRAKRNY